MDEEEFDNLCDICSAADEFLSFVRGKYYMTTDDEFECPYMQTLDKNVKNMKCLREARAHK